MCLKGNLLVLLKGQSGDSPNTNIPFRNSVRNLFQGEPKPPMEGTRWNVLVKKRKDVEHKLCRFSEASAGPLDQEDVRRRAGFRRASVGGTAETSAEPGEGGGKGLALTAGPSRQAGMGAAILTRNTATSVRDPEFVRTQVLGPT